MHVCHVITRLIIGGAQENTVLTCRGLVERGRRVTLISGPETGPEGSLWEQAKESGAELVLLDSMARAVHPLKDLNAAKALVRLFRQIRPDIVHTHSSKAGILGRYAASRAKVPVIVHTVHGMSFNRTQRPWTRWVYRTLERRAAKWTTGFISVADAMTRQCVEAGIAEANRFRLIRSGLQTEQFHPDSVTRREVRQRLGLADTDIAVGTIARLFDNKGYDEIIKAMPELVRSDDRLRFVWIGDGKRREEYRSRLRRLGLLDRVNMVGLVAPNEVAGLLCGLDMLVHTSRWEGLPRAVVQALLTQVAVVSFDNDGAPEVVRPGETGLLVPLGNQAALVQAVLQLAGDARLRERLGATGRMRCLAEFDWKRMVEQIDAYYRELLGEDSPSPGN